MKTRSRNRAAALIIVLSVIVVLSVLILSLTVAMRMERTAAHYYSERARADLLARAGVECVKAALLEATAPDRKWVSMPGAILSVTGTGANLSGGALYNLYSGSATAGLGAELAPADLNRAVLSDDNQPAIDPDDAAPMSVAWVYVREDGTYETNASPAMDPANPVIGRFAYWADDESARINLNTAWQAAGNDATASHPNRINLNALTNLSTVHVSQIHQRATNAPFGSPDESRRLSTSVAEVLSHSRFSTTHRSHSPSLNPWGEPKIFLTTQLSNLPIGFTNAYPAYTNYFLDILKAPNTDPGSGENISISKYKYQLNRIRQLFERSDWPSVSDTLSNKYGAVNTMQIAMDIIGHVRSAESASNFVEAVYVEPAADLNNSKVGNTDAWAPNGLAQTNLMIDGVRRPMLSEIGVQVSDLIQPPRFQIVFKLEFYFPPGSGLDASMLVGAKIRTVASYEPDPGNWNPIPSFNTTLTADMIESGVPNYGIVTFPRLFVLQGPAKDHTNRPTSMYMTFSLRPGNTSTTLETAPIAAYSIDTTAVASRATNALIRYEVDPVGTSTADITTVKARDPRINKYGVNWSANSPADWNNLPARTLLGLSPAQDLAADGTVSDHSLAPPSAKGTTNNAVGLIGSVGALGKISTGVGVNIPWRTLRLQPNPTPTAFPDWGILDLFQAPILPAMQVSALFPNTNSVAGRINVNTEIQPFIEHIRQAPLHAMFQDSLSSGAAIISSNIANRIYAANGNPYGHSNVLDTIGELAEIRGVADSGEESEDILREIIDQAAVQGNVFRIHSVGQALKQNPAGTSFTIQAERRITTIVERQANGKLRIVYWKIVPI